MRTVELLGPSGVGKTFLYHKVFDTHRDRYFLGIRDAYLKSALSYRPDFEISVRYLFYWLLRAGLFRNRAQGLARKILTEDELFADFKFYKVTSEVLKNYLLKEEEISIVMRRLQNFTDVVKRDMIMNRSLDSGQVVFFDEGMLHHHHGLNIEVLDQYTKEEISGDRALNPFAVVSCEVCFETLMDRVKMRKASGIKTFSHGILSDLELESYVFKNMNEYKRKIDMIQKIGIPVLKIDTLNDAGQNADEIIFFINGLN